MFRILVIIFVINITLETNVEKNNAHKTYLSRRIKEFIKNTTTLLSKISLNLRRSKNISKLIIKVDNEKKTKKNSSQQNSSSCCHTCKTCFNDRSCCCPELACHPIAIKCDSPIKNTRWYVEKINSSDFSKFHKISNDTLMIKISIINEINYTLNMNVMGNEYETKIVFNHPSLSLVNYAIKAVCNESLVIFHGILIINGLEIREKSYIQHRLIKCEPFFLPCK